jgi:hypothetical protein
MRPKRARLFSLFPLGTILLAIPAMGLIPAGAEEKKKEEPGKKGAAKDAPRTKGEEPTEHALQAWGVIKEVKGTPFFSLAYTKSDGRKATKETVFVKPAESASYFQDKVISLTDLKEGDGIWILGRPVEHEVADKTGTKGVDRQFQNVTAVAAGVGIRVNSKYKDPRDPKVLWSRAEVTKAGPSITVTCEGAEYKVTTGKQTPVLLREKAEAKPLKNGVSVEVSCDKSEERPDTKSAADAKKEAFVAPRRPPGPPAGQTSTSPERGLRARTHSFLSRANLGVGSRC